MNLEVCFPAFCFAADRVLVSLEVNKCRTNLDFSIEKQTNKYSLSKKWQYQEKSLWLAVLPQRQSNTWIVAWWCSVLSLPQFQEATCTCTPTCRQPVRHPWQVHMLSNCNDKSTHSHRKSLRRPQLQSHDTNEVLNIFCSSNPFEKVK